MIIHFFNFETPVITVFAEDTDGSRNELFAHALVCVCVCVCVCVSWIACARVCITCVMHVDLKVQEGMKVKIRMKHTRMPRPRRMPASYSCTPHTQACTHARMPRTLYYARQAWLACYACVCSVRDASAIRAWLSCVRVVWAWVVCRYAW